MDLFSIQCFIAVVETNSFTKAADQVGRTQSAITQQISNLEKTLQAKLFERGKKIKLTSQGELFLTYALKINALNREALDRFKQPDLDGEVRFGVPEDFATLLLTDVLVDFTRAHPRVALNVECDLTLNLFERFKQEKLDLVLLKMSSPRDFPHGVEIWSEPLVWASKTNGAAFLDEKKPLSLVLSPAPCIYRSAALESLNSKDIASNIVFTSPSYNGIIAAVRANLGLTVLPSTMIPDGIEALNHISLPTLPELHVSLLSKEKESGPIASLKNHLLKKLLVQRRNLHSDIPQILHRVAHMTNST
ncbi:MAG: LysR family transcriptional regulator [Verrucomicrobia bacterium]|nr:LysR family transcriptional regulator [Verrucomicrobiota bacterium]